MSALSGYSRVRSWYEQNQSRVSDRHDDDLDQVQVRSSQAPVMVDQGTQSQRRKFKTTASNTTGTCGSQADSCGLRQSLVIAAVLLVAGKLGYDAGEAKSRNSHQVATTAAAPQDLPMQTLPPGYRNLLDICRGSLDNVIELHNVVAHGLGCVADVDNLCTMNQTARRAHILDCKHRQRNQQPTQEKPHNGTLFRR